MPPVSRAGPPLMQASGCGRQARTKGCVQQQVPAVHRTCSVAMSVGMGTTSLGMSEMESPGMQLRASGGSGVSCAATTAA